MMPSLLYGATGEATVTVSESGWSNAVTEVFEKYMKRHLLKYLPARDKNHVIVLYD
jgi:hypothetical protein